MCIRDRLTVSAYAVQRLGCSHCAYDYVYATKERRNLSVQVGSIGFVSVLFGNRGHGGVSWAVDHASATLLHNALELTLCHDNLDIVPEHHVLLNIAKTQEVLRYSVELNVEFPDCYFVFLYNLLTLPEDLGVVANVLVLRTVALYNTLPQNLKDSQRLREIYFLFFIFHGI